MYIMGMNITYLLSVLGDERQRDIVVFYNKHFTCFIDNLANTSKAKR
jgi:hypothetical protein